MLCFGYFSYDEVQKTSACW